MTHTADLTLEFVTPNMPALRQAKKTCNAKLANIQVLHNNTNYLPEQTRKINDFNSALNEADVYLPGAAQSMAIDLRFKADAIIDLQAELAEATDAKEREEILDDLDQALGTAAAVTRSNATTLHTHLQSLLTPFDQTATQGYLARFEADAIKLSDDIVLLKAKKDVLDDERKILTDAIAAIESKNIDEISKEALLNAESLLKLGLTPPEMKAAEAALELLKQAQEQLGEILNFFSLISLRDGLVGRINTLVSDMSAKNAELNQVESRIKLIEFIHGFDDERLVYTSEFSKIVEALDLFLDHSRNISNESVEPFLQNVQALIDYLNDIR